MSEDTYDWSRKSLDELEAFYWEEIAPAIRRSGRDPETERPTYRWLADHGFAGIDYALREHHDLTVAEFFAGVVGVGEDAGEDNEWGIDHEPTREALDRYLAAREKRKNWAASTIDAKRSRLATYARTYREIHGEADLVSALDDPDERPAETERCYAVLDALDERLESDDSKYHYLVDAGDFYARRVDTGRAEYDPLANATSEFDWDRTGGETHALGADGVRALYRVADSQADRVLVLALCGLGLRPSEVAALHRRQLDLSDDDPHVAFEDDRKNGPGTVAIIYGRDVLQDRVDRLSGPEWSGYVFPSHVSSTGHRSTDTIRNRFGSLAERADVRVDGERPTPKHGRRFWYDAYLDAQGELLDRLDEIAPDQGSASAEVIAEHYVPEERKRALRRELMRERLAAAFEPLSGESEGRA